MRVVAIGGGGHAVEVVDAILDAARRGRKRVSLLGYVDHSETQLGELFGLRYLGSDKALIGLNFDAVVLAMGSPDARRNFFVRSGISVGRLLTFVHPLAHLGSQVRLGAGSVVLPHASCTANARIGIGTLIGRGAQVSHDCRVGSWSSLFPMANLAGGATVSAGVTVGASAFVREGCLLSPGAVVGAGAVVLRDVGPRQTVVGVPARPLTMP